MPLAIVPTVIFGVPVKPDANVALPTVKLAFVPLTPFIVPPVIATLLAFWVDIVPKVPRALTAVATYAVVAIFVELSLAACVVPTAPLAMVVDTVVAVVAVAAFPPIERLVTGVVEFTKNGAVPVDTTDVNVVPNIVPELVTEAQARAPLNVPVVPDTAPELAKDVQVMAPVEILPPDTRL